MAGGRGEAEGGQQLSGQQQQGWTFGRSSVLVVQGAQQSRRCDRPPCQWAGKAWRTNARALHSSEFGAVGQARACSLALHLHACLLALGASSNRHRRRRWRLLALAGGGGSSCSCLGCLLLRLVRQHVLHLGHDVLAVSVLAQRLEVRLQWVGWGGGGVG